MSDGIAWQPISFRLRPEDYRGLDTIREREGIMSRSEALRFAIKQVLKRYEAEDVQKKRRAR